jgi:hypothetical protein
MIQSETEGQACVCPECGYRCNACLGTNSIITREQLASLKNVEWFTPVFDRPLNDEEAEEQEQQSQRDSF